MKYSVLLFLLSLVFSQNPALAQKPNSTSDSEIIDSIPFELSSHNNIILKALLNNQDSLKLMFHTDAGHLSLISSKTALMKSIKWKSETELKSWGGSSKSRYSEGNNLSIGRIIWDSLPIWENLNSGPGTDGKIGPYFFEGKVLELDFEKKLIIVQKNLPSKIQEFQKIPILNERGSMYIEGWTIIGENRFKNKFLIHSGFGGTILYDDAFTAENNLGEQLEITSESELRDSFGNVLKTKKAILPKFQIAEFILSDLPIGFFEGSIGKQKISVVGGDLLKRFNIIWDADRKYIYLKPNELAKLPFSG